MIPLNWKENVLIYNKKEDIVMKKMACFAVTAAMILSTFSYALADNYTDY